jgi:hypothetical protein
LYNDVLFIFDVDILFLFSINDDDDGGDVGFVIVDDLVLFVLIIAIASSSCNIYDDFKIDNLILGNLLNELKKCSSGVIFDVIIFFDILTKLVDE